MDTQSPQHPRVGPSDRPSDGTGRRLERQSTPQHFRALAGWAAAALTCALLAVPTQAALPVFESNTPTGFSPEDSTSAQDFVEGSAVTVRVDLNQAATPTYPVIGHFHNLETSQVLDSSDIDGSRVDIALAPNGIVHAAWIASETEISMTTPVYFVRYARSNDDGVTFTSPVSVSGSLRFDLLSPDGSGVSFSTLDLEVDSRGNPRVVYALNDSPDGNTAQFSGNNDNIYLNYSENGGASWLPSDKAIVVNDTFTVGEGTTSAFPRMAIDQRDNIFITYVRGSSLGGGAGGDDVMLARVDRETSPFTMEGVGSAGTVGSTGGVRISPDAGDRQTGPDIAVGTGDVLHVVWFHEDATAIEHKTLLGDDWDDITTSTGWDQDTDGASIDAFDPDPATNASLDTDATFVFPTVVVDTVSTPDRIYSLYKFGDATFETVFFNSYSYDHAIADGGGWVAASAQAVWSTATSPVFSSGNGSYEIELDWEVVDRVSAVVDDRRTDVGELHIVFSAGYSNTTASTANQHDIYYGFYNGQSWTLPEVVADHDAGTTDGVLSTDVFLQAPVLDKRSGDENLYMAFLGGTAEGFGVEGVNDVNNHPYYKVLGRAVTSEDESRPVGGFQYDLTYTPINPHTASSSAEVENNAVFVHAADNLTGEGLGATGKQSDSFLAGDWEAVVTSSLYEDDDKFFEGRINEDTGSTHEWGDDDDKTGLLVKLNALGSDSSTNLQLITNSTASDAGTGLGARGVSVLALPQVSLATGDFFLLGADIDIIDANTSPTVSVTSPDGVADTANTSFPIRYTLSDPDDDFGSGLTAALYFSESGVLGSVQDIQIFGTLIADENDNTAVNSSGTDDFTEGSSQTYSWDDPPTALKSLLFASILQAPSADYFIYLVADDGKNPPVFAVSPGVLSVRHKPLVLQVDPAVRDTVDTGERSGDLANPYDLDFAIRDYDNQGDSQVALFYSAVSGLTSVSVWGPSYPNQTFTLGKSLAGIRGQFIEKSDTLTSADTEFSWDVTDSVYVNPDSAAVAEGQYYLYVVVSDSTNVVVGESAGQLVVKHSPSFVFYEPAKDTYRLIDSGSQSRYTIQWQKGPGDQDFDNDATIDLYFTTDNPVTINYEDDPDSLLKDSDTQPLVKGLSEDGELESDMYVWNFRNLPEAMPIDSVQVWLYAVVSDENGNEDVVLGGSLRIAQGPFIGLTSSDLSDLGTFDLNDILRVSWDAYLVDDGSSTDDAYIRLYATTNPSAFTDIATLDVAATGGGTFLINSDDGTRTGVVDTLRESGDSFFDWNTRLFGAAVDYDIYAAISTDPTFSDNSAGGVQLAKSSTALSVGGGGSTPEVGMSPTDMTVSIGDTVTLDVTIQNSTPINLVQVVLLIDDNDFLVRDQDSNTAGTQPFVDLGNVFPSTTAIENQVVTTTVNQLRFAKSTFTGELVGTTTEPAGLCRFQLVARTTLASPAVTFASGETGTVLGQVGNPDPLTSPGIALTPVEMTEQSRGIISATVELEGRDVPPATGDNTTLLDIHLRLAGSTIDIDDQNYREGNDEDGDTADSVRVMTDAAGLLELSYIPAGRYVLTVKDTSHVSGRTDTIEVRNGETVTISSGNSNGFFGSDLRGDPTTFLPSTGFELIAGDASGDNEIDEDDVNLIIAAWGTDDTEPSFEESDINNDDIVGAADLTVTASNFGNSQGFGAPPVFRRTDGQRPTLALAPLAERAKEALAPGDVIGFEVRGQDLEDLAGYEFRLDLDERRLRPLLNRVSPGDVFDANPHGSFFDVRYEEGAVHVLSSRIGKDWAATGEGGLAQLWFEVLDAGAEQGLGLGDGVLLSSTYQPAPVTWSNSLIDLLLPAAPSLDVNYPNPFNPSTAIPVALPVGQDVSLQIYNLLGQRVRTLMTGHMDQGFYTILWNGRDDAGRAVAAGLYISELKTSDFRQTRKMTLLK